MSDSAPMGYFATLLAEARRRHVFRVAGVYADVAFGVLQTADIVAPTLGLPEATISYLLTAIAIGFPLALALTWLVDMTPEGIRITPGLNHSEQRQLAPGRVIDVVILVVALAVGFLYLERFTGSDEGMQPDIVAQPSPVIDVTPSIAVLPFENLSTSEENAFFAAGVHEDILNNLAQIRDLIVISRTSTLGYGGVDKPPIPQIAQELNATHVLEGSVRRAGDRIRVTVQLIEAASDKHLWSNTYDRRLEDVFAMQDEIADEIADKLSVRFELLREGNPTRSLEAYELFLQARNLASTNESEDVQNALTLYQQALAIDPDYADAWAGFSIAISDMDFVGTVFEDPRAEALDAAEKALELNEDSWIANFAMGMYMGSFRVERFADADRYFQKAILLNPGDATLRLEYGQTLWQMGRYEETAEQLLEGYQRSPLSAEGNIARARIASMQYDVASVQRYAAKALSIRDDRSQLQFDAGVSYWSIGDIERAAHHFYRAVEIDETYTPAMAFLAEEIFTLLGDYVTAEYWLDRAGEVDPWNSQYLWRRANNLSNQERYDEYERLIRTWYEREPDNAQARRYMGYIPNMRSVEAQSREDTQAMLEYRQQALALQLDYIRPDESFVDVQVWNVWTFLSSGLTAKILGDDELALDMFRRVVAFNEAAPEGSRAYGQLAVAYAGMHEPVKSIEALNEYYNRGAYSVQGLKIYHVLDDKFDAYGGIHRDLAFVDVVARLRERNDQILANLRRELSELFPPD
ncbi:MAG: hypothetical protein AAF525_00710 [Pseudomonadota bacterium]